MIDTHCHLTDHRLLDQLPAVLGRMREMNVTHAITIATTPEDARDAISLAESHDNVACAIGVHPNHSHEVSLESLESLRSLATHAKVVALGEMGLDYHYGMEHRELQHTYFRWQLDLAREIGKPAVIHCRDAVADALAVLADFPVVRCDFHCFTGTLDDANRIIDRGYTLGFTGAVTFKKADELRAIAARVPASQLLVETDAPYLTPEPMRKQKVNEPAMTRYVGEVVAAARGISIDELDTLTTLNAQRFFGWPG